MISEVERELVRVFGNVNPHDEKPWSRRAPIHAAQRSARAVPGPSPALQPSTTGSARRFATYDSAGKKLDRVCVGHEPSGTERVAHENSTIHGGS